MLFFLSKRIIGSHWRLKMTLLVLLLPSGILSQDLQDRRDLAVEKVQSGASLDGHGRLWAVIIGISQYKNLPQKSQLRFANRDAEELAAFLRSPNGGGFPSSNIKLLIDTEASLSAVRTALGTWLTRSAELSDVVYIFFAGHGVVENEQDGYLLAYDSDPQNLYATALSVVELNKIVADRLKARMIILIADACHSGNLGWASRGTDKEVLINRYLDEMGKTGTGVVKLLASRANERSFEDERWGGGHGVFTYFLLEGLKGKADLDKDSVVRASELIDFLSEVVPEQTQALQHPRVAGNLEARLPLAVLSPGKLTSPPEKAMPTQLLSLEIRGASGIEVSLDKVHRGQIGSGGVLAVGGIAPGRHEVSLESPGAEPLTQSLQLVASKTVLDVTTTLPGQAVLKSSPLVIQIKQALVRGTILEKGGGWDLYQRLIFETPNEPQRPSLELALGRALDEIEQQAINEYVRSPFSQLRPDLFHRAAAAVSYLKSLRPSDSSLEAKKLFFEGRALLVEKKPAEALEKLTKANALDPRAAYVQNALGVAYEAINKEEKALSAFKAAAALAPAWSLPHLHLAIQYQNRGQLDQAEREFKMASELDPREPFTRVTLARLLRTRGKSAEAEREITDVLRQTSNYAPAYVELGLIYESNREYAKAADAFDTYLRLAPNAQDSATIQALLDKNRQLSVRRQPSLKSKTLEDK